MLQVDRRCSLGGECRDGKRTSARISYCPDLSSSILTYIQKFIDVYLPTYRLFFARLRRFYSLDLCCLERCALLWLHLPFLKASNAEFYEKVFILRVYSSLVSSFPLSWGLVFLFVPAAPVSVEHAVGLPDCVTSAVAIGFLGDGGQ